MLGVHVFAGAPTDRRSARTVATADAAQQFPTEFAKEADTLQGGKDVNTGDGGWRQPPICQPTTAPDGCGRLVGGGLDGQLGLPAYLSCSRPVAKSER